MARPVPSPLSARLGEAKCLALLVAVRLALTILGYARLRRLLPRAEASAASPHHARNMGRRIERMARFVPGASCLTQAIALHVLLERQGHRSQIEIGVAREGADARFAAHAWVTCEDHVVLGARGVDPAGFTRIAKLG